MNHPDDARGYAAGMTERAYIATAAMAAIISAGGICNVGEMSIPDAIADAAVIQADALAARLYGTQPE